MKCPRCLTSSPIKLNGPSGGRGWGQKDPNPVPIVFERPLTPAKKFFLKSINLPPEIWKKKEKESILDFLNSAIEKLKKDLVKGVLNFWYLVINR